MVVSMISSAEAAAGGGDRRPTRKKETISGIRRERVGIWIGIERGGAAGAIRLLGFLGVEIAIEVERGMGIEIGIRVGIENEIEAERGIETETEVERGIGIVV